MSITNKTEYKTLQLLGRKPLRMMIIPLMIENERYKNIKYTMLVVSF